MIKKWIHKTNRSKAIVFFSGWGNDEVAFRTLDSLEYDVLFINNYSSLDINEDLSTYKELVIIGWSMGVYISTFLNPSVKNVKRVAINGTINPIDNKEGIPRSVFQKMHDFFSISILTKFYFGMCGNKETYSFYTNNQSQRSIESQKNELKYLLEITKNNKAEKRKWDTIIISDNDQIIPTAAQRFSWKDQNIVEIKGGHYIFDRYTSWDELTRI